MGNIYQNKTEPQKMYILILANIIIVETVKRWYFNICSSEVGWNLVLHCDLGIFKTLFLQGRSDPGLKFNAKATSVLMLSPNHHLALMETEAKYRGFLKKVRGN